MRDIECLHPTLQQKVIQLSKLCAQEGIMIAVTETLRTAAEQNALYAKGRTAPGNIVTNASGSTFSSMHQWGIAFDICLKMDVDKDGSVSDDAYNNQTKLFNRIGALGKSIGLEWGGDWKSIKDLPHFQLPDWGSTATRLKKAYGAPDEFFRCWGHRETVSLVTAIQSSNVNRGVFKDLVKAVQTALNEEYACELKVDGVPGVKTLTQTPTLSRVTGKRSPKLTTATQNLLYFYGYDCVGDEEGDFNLRTANMVEKFQQEMLNAKGDGEITKRGATWQKLLQLR